MTFTSNTYATVAQVLAALLIATAVGQRKLRSSASEGELIFLTTTEALGTGLMIVGLFAAVIGTTTDSNPSPWLARLSLIGLGFGSSAVLGAALRPTMSTREPHSREPRRSAVFVTFFLLFSVMTLVPLTWSIVVATKIK